MQSVGTQVKKKYKDQGLNAYGAGNYEEAITYLEKALDIGTQDSETLIFLAQAYEKKGDTGIANKWYKKVIDDFPGTQYATLAKNYMQANGGVIAEDEPEEGTEEGENGENPEGAEGSPVQQGETVEE